MQGEVAQLHVVIPGLLAVVVVSYDDRKLFFCVKLNVVCYICIHTYYPYMQYYECPQHLCLMTK